MEDKRENKHIYADAASKGKQAQSQAARREGQNMNWIDEFRTGTLPCVCLSSSTRWLANTSQEQQNRNLNQGSHLHAASLSPVLSEV